MTRFLTVELVLLVSGDVIGSPPVVRDYGLLEAAVARPQATVFGEDAYPTLWAKAGALLHSLAANHALVDGNKRTAVHATLTFLELNGINTGEPDEDEIIAVALDVAEGRVTEAGAVGARLRELVRVDP